jgi:hypothetical protein
MLSPCPRRGKGIGSADQPVVPAVPRLREPPLTGRATRSISAPLAGCSPQLGRGSRHSVANCSDLEPCGRGQSLACVAGLRLGLICQARRPRRPDLPLRTVAQVGMSTPEWMSRPLSPKRQHHPSRCAPLALRLPPCPPHYTRRDRGFYLRHLAAAHPRSPMRYSSRPLLIIRGATRSTRVAKRKAGLRRPRSTLFKRSWTRCRRVLYSNHSAKKKARPKPRREGSEMRGGRYAVVL